MMRPYLVNFLRKIPGDYTRDQRDEMTAAALVGLWEGLARFDHDAFPHVKFSNWALNWVRHEVMEWRAKNSRSLPIPRSAWNFARKLEAEWQLQNGPEADITTASDADLSDLSISVVREGRPVDVKVNYAGDVVRGMRQPYLLDPDKHDKNSAESAEDTYWATTNEETRMLDIAYKLAGMLATLPAKERREAALQECEALGWPPEAADEVLLMTPPL
jgi:DNA-directed RNA polymerase specialized sigma24 family protein